MNLMSPQMKVWNLSILIGIGAIVASLFVYSKTSQCNSKVYVAEPKLTPQQIEELYLFQDFLRDVSKTQSFLTESKTRNDLLAQIYKEIDDLIGAILLSSHTSESHYTLWRFRNILEKQYKVSTAKSSVHTSLKVLITQNQFFTMPNLKSLRTILQDITSIHLEDSQLYCNLDWKNTIAARVFRKNSHDPIVEHIMHSYYAHKSQSTAAQDLSQILKTRLNLLHPSPQKEIHNLHEFVSSGIQSLTVHAKEQFLSNLKTLNLSDLNLLIILSKFKTLQFGEFLRGAHFVLEDQGWLYTYLKNHHIIDTHKRISSHYQKETPLNHEQRGLAQKSPLFSEILFGVMTSPSKELKTWIQTEKHGFGKLEKLNLGFTQFHLPINRITDSLSHLQSFSSHVRSKFHQVGPYGFSFRSEKNNKHISIPQEQLLFLSSLESELTIASSPKTR